ncbi:hypothetical protein AVEN_116021-1 [Araneus ventricosus]|uniref:Nose resistant-to-fluoxetine protein N-terminal domain-containing protein n=1 Tax=Araneus ventricosus TaxID=182803 RepID=A0A4Y2N0Y3_ARAVE|nr:hypothetical protein AVEN_116021-1 [Araneus ventricosus]
MLPETSSNKCVEDLNYVQESLLSPGGWSMKMLDSYGKPESGILVGNLKWLGQYDECVGVQAPSKENTSVGGFRGNYCTLQVPLKLLSVIGWWCFVAVNGFLPFLSHLLYRWALRSA